MAEARLYLPRAAAEGRRVACPDALGALVAEVAEIVGDPAVGEQEIVRALGRGLLAAAAAARLPDLAAEARLPFGPGQEQAALPADLQHGPVDAFLLPGRGRIRMLSNPAALRRAARLPGRGPARLAAAGGGRLHVWPVPRAAVEVAVSYFRLPDPLAGWADKPACLPPHLAGRLLVSFACREVFERLEEGADGRKSQTTAYGARWQAALDELVGLCGPATLQDAPVDVPLCTGEDWS
ncbi:hypothetical protein [Solidesulfovibrio sp.]|uniref:phage adaptor protein n=1 Tax=Solidesulfovibrio sp. TaxID=2910990 RepID=UPI0026347231|nr:hypothetical protein [Solidesulfovibrio sp.]